MSLLFIYGTLKRGHCRESCLKDQAFIGEATTIPGYRLYDCGSYPGLVKDKKENGQVKGELWSVDENVFDTLDSIEGVEIGLYRRGFVRVISESFSGQAISYFYLGNPEGLRDCGGEWAGD